jgi:hypothetical protein
VTQRLPRLLPWLDMRRPDVVCRQETKLAAEAFTELLAEEPARRVGFHKPITGADVTKDNSHDDRMADNCDGQQPWAEAKVDRVERRGLANAWLMSAGSDSRSSASSAGSTSAQPQDRTSGWPTSSPPPAKDASYAWWPIKPHE